MLFCFFGALSMKLIVAESFPSGSRHNSQHAPNKASPPVALSTQPVLDSNAFTSGSEYAVMYRRGTGVVSGSAENQGTSTALDLEGFKSTNHDTLQARSPGNSAKMSRRAAMHITGPTLVTVPLHITTNLAFGVLQREGGERIIHYGRDKDGKCNAPDKEKTEEMRIKSEEGEKNDEVLMDRIEDTGACGRTEGESEKKEKQQENQEDCGYKSEMVVANGSRDQPEILPTDSEEVKVVNDDTDNDEASEYMGNCIHFITNLLPPQTYYPPFIHLSSHASITASIHASIHPDIHAVIGIIVQYMSSFICKILFIFNFDPAILLFSHILHICQLYFLHIQT